VNGPAPALELVRDPWRRTVAVAVLLVVAGLVAVGAAWSGAAATHAVPEQVAFAFSGGAGGLALVGTGLALVDIPRRRLVSARDSVAVAEMTAELTDLAERIASAKLRTAPGGASARR
jgi:hypothetical protein